MHKYFNFSKIYEAEQMGIPLDPEEMGTPGSLTNVEPTDKLEDFALLAKENLLEITLTQKDMDTLAAKKSAVLKDDAKWKNKSNETNIKDVKLVILNTSNEAQDNDPSALLFNLDDKITKQIIEGISVGGTSILTQVLTGTAQDGTIIKDITVKFIKSVELDTAAKETTIPASPEQIADGSVTPEIVAGELPNESRGIMSFGQFVNESKKKSIMNTPKKMEKGALKKDLVGAKDKKEDAKLKKKPKKEGKFPDISGDGRVTKKDILIAKGVIKK
jgi:hypothetical protein